MCDIAKSKVAGLAPKDRELAAAIGLQGLFDSAQRIHDLSWRKIRKG